jgi:hypothetical protein
MASSPTGWHFGVAVRGGGYVFPNFVFTYTTEGLGLSMGQRISTDGLAQYSAANFRSVRMGNAMNGCVESQNEGNRVHLQEIRDRNVTELTVIGIAPVYE